jgi:hypothetical protein
MSVGELKRWSLGYRKIRVYIVVKGSCISNYAWANASSTNVNIELDRIDSLL